MATIAIERFHCSDEALFIALEACPTEAGPVASIEADGMEWIKELEPNADTVEVRMLSKPLMESGSPFVYSIPTTRSATRNPSGMSCRKMPAGGVLFTT